MRAFISHSAEDSSIAIEIAKHLRRCLRDGVFYYEEHQLTAAAAGFQPVVDEQLAACDALVVLVGRKLATARSANESYQIQELNTFQSLQHSPGCTKYITSVRLRDGNGNPYEPPPVAASLDTNPRFDLPTKSDPALIPFGSRSRLVAYRIIEHLGETWRSADDLPFDPNLFSLEKHIVDFFVRKAKAGETLFTQTGEAGRHLKMRDVILSGCPSTWSTVEHDPGDVRNPLSTDILGTYREPSQEVIVDARAESGEAPVELRFPEAGPREFLRYGHGGRPLKAAILVSGGIAPGTNAVIDGIVQRHNIYATSGGYEPEILGIENGFSGICPWNARPLRPEHTARHASHGGSLLPTSRVSSLITEGRSTKLTDIARELLTQEVDILYVIGGDGSMRAAHAIRSYIEEMRCDAASPQRVAVVGVPKTMDNDILWVWQSFGFLTAVEKAREIVEHLVTEVTSNPRACVVQLFGSDSGFVVSHAALASSGEVCDAALIPEVPFCMEGLASHLIGAIYRRERERRERSYRDHRGAQIPSTMVIKAETAIPVDASNYIDDPEFGLSDRERKAIREFEKMRQRGARLQGQTPDELRDAGIKILLGGLKKAIPDVALKTISSRSRLSAERRERLPAVDWSALRVFSSEPRHLLRAAPPNTVDLIAAQRLGILAVDNALAGYTDFMISQWLTEYVLVPLKLVTLGRKRIPESGMFWKSVIAKTGQPERMLCGACEKRVTDLERGS